MSAPQDELLDVRQLTSGLRAESLYAARSLSFSVRSCVQLGPTWKVKVDTEDSRGALREAIEGATAWWPEPDRGSADVLAVIPEDDTLLLRFATAAPPQSGNLLVYPVQFLEALERLWLQNEWAERCSGWLRRAVGPNASDTSRCVDPKSFKRLRRAQRAAFTLPSRHTSFLWGPPGTGKTFTLGCLLAQYLNQFPQDRVLLLSTTNTAVDHALVAVDEGVEMLGAAGADVAALRKGCVRVGNRFAAAQYKDRGHLLPTADEAKVRELVALEASRPDKSDAVAFAAWTSKVEAVRAAIRKRTGEVIGQSRLAAMTTTLAAFQFDDLRSFAPFDLIAFDEASQIGCAHALALAPLGKRCLFAGDPRQLAPICQSDHPGARDWLGKSMFRYMDESSDSTCMLDEQSRMAEPICSLVSEVFYRGKLKVAEDAKRNPDWRRERTPPPIPGIGEAPAVLVSVPSEAHPYSHKYNGPIRWDSAEMVADLVTSMLEQGMDAEDILVVTPFHSQRVLINQKLKGSGCRGVQVSTVHRAQGGERHTVIFDPVHGSTDFFEAVLDSRRLVNVAISRAKSRVVVLLSDGDRGNKLLDAIATVLDPPGQIEGCVRVQDVVHGPLFPDCVVGTDIQITETLAVHVVRVLDGGGRFEAKCLRSGQTKIFHTEFLREKHKAR